jgi:Holliday junction resolvasome RuvABC endonuclease subunit
MFWGRLVKNYKILSFDVSSVSTGWAFLSKNKRDYGVLKTNPKEGRANRLSYFRSQVKKLLNTYKPTDIVLEDVYSGPSVKTLVVLSKFAGVLEECCFSNLKLSPYLIHTSTVKAYFKAKNKEEVFNAIISTFEFEEKKFDFKKHNDVTDALAQAVCYYDCVINESNECRIEKDYGYFYEV